MARLALACLMALVSSAATAQESGSSPAATTSATAPLLTATTEAAYRPTWSTTTRFGYGVSRESSTGFAGVGGSLMSVDAARIIRPGLDVGLRTSGAGGRGAELEFYRLGSGPFVSWEAFEGWRLDGHVAAFRESGLRPGGNAVYRSQGYSWTFGWERTTAFLPRVDVSWGGFVQSHRGDLVALPQPAQASLTRLASANRGLTQGLVLGLRIGL